MDTPPSSTVPAWYPGTKTYETPHRSKATVQLVNTLLPFAAVIGLSLWLAATGAPWYALLPLAVFAGLLQMRLFVLFHDCTHQSFLASRRANFFWGMVLGTLALTPYHGWRKSHGIHHAHNGNLDRRGVGDVWTMTLEEYQKASRGRRLLYRIYRNPLFLILFIPPFLFLVIHRIPDKDASSKELWNGLITSAGSLLLILAAGWWGGWFFLLAFVLPMVYVATVGGVWLFYVQHQFDPGYWEKADHWSHFEAAMLGSSHYKLPRVFQWFSGNIGFHHIHHLRPRIPNYRLEECYRAVRELQLPDPLTVRTSLRGLFLHLWDEQQRRLLSFRAARLG